MNTHLTPSGGSTQASDLVKDTSTKYSLVLGSSASLSGPAVESIAAEMRNACDQLNVALR